jgi:hypothetical protein
MSTPKNAFAALVLSGVGLETALDAYTGGDDDVAAALAEAGIN